MQPARFEVCQGAICRRSRGRRRRRCCSVGGLRGAPLRELFFARALFPVLVSLQVTGGSASGAIPVNSGPRHCGQKPAAADSACAKSRVSDHDNSKSERLDRTLTQNRFCDEGFIIRKAFLRMTGLMRWLISRTACAAGRVFNVAENAQPRRRWAPVANRVCRRQ